jgi:hypothetical protein
LTFYVEIDPGKLFTWREKIPPASPQGTTLRQLDGGLEIIRYRKHEPIHFDQLMPEELVWKTGKRWGSKFLANWTLDRYVTWIAAQVQQLGWPAEAGVHRSIDIRERAAVGYSRGKLVYNIRLVADGRYVHAYPVGEND